MYPVALALYQSFLHFYHLDHSNAAIHTGSVRYSPITFRLSEALKQKDVYIQVVHEGWSEHELIAVWKHAGQYPEDTGR